MLISRAEQIGSLKRPSVLLQKRLAFQQGKCSAEEMKACEDESIAAVVRMQLDLGLTTITDGEYRRTIFYDGFFEHLEGLKVVHDPPQDIFQSFNFVRYMPTTRIFTGKLERAGPLYGEAFDFLKKVAGPENLEKLKHTMGSPEWYHFRHGKYTFERTAYANDDEYFEDLTKIYQDEIADLYSRGCRRIQIDDPILTCFCDESYRQLMEQDGVDPEELFGTYIRVLNGCIQHKPADLIMGIHLCRGNVKPDRQPFTRGPYDRIAKRLFNDLNFDTYYLEYDTEQAGSFDPLRHLPPTKRVVLGLVSTKTPELEDPGVVRGRILEAAEVIARGEIPRSVEEALNQFSCCDRLSLSPQCGFASHSAGFDVVTHEDMVKKLTLVREVAQEVWGKV
ncbi:UROD/MetE-like protein [Trametes coccinea BRFM310]|uniref:UROD/MetE-like protein n=1 Tax=Trametes coccinea (strain BRFM310) TaxID=1353009 RepID=A0A1Y2IXX9_TRAC3|nr:UROD/MetE-like protein [Trametes coccinea BRFM310]